jgi:hypothetical protein
MAHLTRPKIFIMALFAVLPVPASFNFSYRSKLFFGIRVLQSDALTTEQELKGTLQRDGSG